MKTYIIYKWVPPVNGEAEKKAYLKEDKTFTYNEAEAKEYKVRWWIELLKVLAQIFLQLNAAGVLKIKQK